MRRPALVLMLALGCAVGPEYRRPEVEVPPSFRGAEGAVTPEASLADQDWTRVFPDPTLDALLREAVAYNQDVQIAAARIEEAGAQLGIARADQWPTVNVGIAAGRERLPAAPPLISPITTNVLQATGSLSWELDFWGKYRRASEAARAEFLAAEWNHRAVITTLVSEVASGYYQLQELDLELQISQRTLGSREESLDLTRLQERQGAVSILDVRQAEQLVYNARQAIIDVERRREQQENLLSLLLGRNPGPIARGCPLTEESHEAVVPAGVPSSLLERRPDIQFQEAQLMAANARIGVARAAYFPSISLTASGGAQSSALAGLFKGPAAAWSFIGSLTQPIFEGGKLRSGVRLAEAQKKEQLVTYQQTIRRAFRDVSDALVAYRSDRESREQQELLATSASEALALSEQLYRGGAASYLEVLDASTRTFAAEIGLAQAQLNELLAVVQLYTALGGGWQAAASG